MQFRRVVGLMHRQVVKAQAEGLYFKVSCLHLFQQILDDQLSLPKGEGTQDLFQLIKFVLRKFFKRLEADPFLMIDALQPKTRGKWKGISSYESDEDDGMAGQRGRIREQVRLKEEESDEQMGELTFIKSKNLPWSKQVGVAVTLLVKEEKKPWIETLLEVCPVLISANARNSALHWLCDLAFKLASTWLEKLRRWMETRIATTTRI